MSDRDSPDVLDQASDRHSTHKSISRERSATGNGEPERRSHSRSRSRSRSRSFSHRRRSYSRSRSRSRGRRGHRYASRSRSRSPKHRYSKSRSRSYTPRRSYSPRYSPKRSSYYDEKGYSGGGGGGRYGGGRSYSGGAGGGGSGRYARSPMSSRRRHVGNRDRSSDNPEPSRCLGVFGLSLYTQERELREVFGKYGPIEDVQVVYDAQSGRSRGFAFVYFEDVEDSKSAKERCNGQEIDGRKIRVDYSITKRAHTPTPGIYMGKPTYPRYGGRGGEDREYYRERHSPSPYYSRHRYSRSRSRSYSPRQMDEELKKSNQIKLRKLKANIRK